MKKLKEILFKVNIDSVYGDTEINVSKITFDSREVENNALFVALSGHNYDGHDYISQSVKSGASVVICEKLPNNFKESNIVFICVKCSKTALSIIASNFFDNPSSKIDLIGVTGTNGKTTISSLLNNLFNELQVKSGLISTINIKYQEYIENSNNTTPDPITINFHLSEMIKRKIKVCFIEVSSHGIFQKRVQGIKFKGMVFTNLTHDHIDYHKTFKDYRDTKKIVFDSLGKNSFALINKDDRNAEYMIQNTKANIYTYSLKSKSNFSCRIIEQQLDGMLLSIDNSEIWAKLIGKFNASNILAIYSVGRIYNLDKINLFDQFIHRQTTAQTVRYTTKELLDLEIKINQANKLINDLEIDFYLILKKRILEEKKNIFQMSHFIAQLDIANMTADQKLFNNYNIPKIIDGRKLFIKNGRHPVVEETLPLVSNV